MNELVKLISEKTGLAEDKATDVVNTVLGFVKDKLPAGIGDQVMNLVKDQNGDGKVDLSDIAGGVKDMLGGLFGK